MSSAVVGLSKQYSVKLNELAETLSVSKAEATRQLLEFALQRSKVEKHVEVHNVLAFESVSKTTSNKLIKLAIDSEKDLRPAKRTNGNGKVTPRPGSVTFKLVSLLQRLPSHTAKFATLCAAAKPALNNHVGSALTYLLKCGAIKRVAYGTYTLTNGEE
jgi:hypothetical protein